MADWLSIARTVAPTLATGLLGPLGGVVANLAGDLIFGPEDKPATVTPQSVMDKIASIASPEGLAKLREAELAVKKLEADNGFRLAELAQKDVDSSRSMRTAALGQGNRTADRLAWVNAAAFFAALFTILWGCYAILVGDLKVTPENNAVWLAVSAMVGSVFTHIANSYTQIIGFFFGSSQGSSDKNDGISASMQEAIKTLAATPARPAASPPGTTADDLNARQLAALNGG
jgi:hypothetical protein